MQLRIKLTPPQPYFLGGERIFEIGDNNKHYYIRSMRTPAQTTLFGILRYLAIKEVSGEPRALTAEEKVKYSAGSTSYNLLCPSKVGFGKINGISPLYLLDGEGNYYIRTPFDHISGYDEKDGIIYSPFKEYVGDLLNTKKFPRDFIQKQGIADSWLCVTPGAKFGKTYKNLFFSESRIGIKVNKEANGFFKKEYVGFSRDGFSFVFFANVANDFDCVPRRWVKPGFNAEVEKHDEPDIPPQLWSKNSGMIYARSDIYISGDDVDKLYGICDFVCVQTKSFRGRITNADAIKIRERYQRYDNAVTLVQAGSVFLPKEGCAESAEDIITGNAHARIAGFNHIISGGKRK